MTNSHTLRHSHLAEYMGERVDLFGCPGESVSGDADSDRAVMNKRQPDAVVRFDMPN